MSGEEQVFFYPEECTIDKLPNILAFAGKFSYGEFEGVGTVYLEPGMSSWDLPTKRDCGSYKMVALEDGAQTYCIHRMGPHGRAPRPDSKKWDRIGGVIDTLKKDHVLLVLSGSVEVDGKEYTAPFILGASKDYKVKVTSPKMGGLEVWSCL